MFDLNFKVEWWDPGKFYGNNVIGVIFVVCAVVVCKSRGGELSGR